MYTFQISTRQLQKDGRPLAVAYSGCGTGKDSPACCSAQMGSLGRGNYGPLPTGRYTIGPAENNLKLGPVAMPLIPDPANQMHGRSGFFLHADSVANPGSASEGCIVPVHGVNGEAGRVIREQIAAGSDRDLEVIA
jgi:hypothetical protein